MFGNRIESICYRTTSAITRKSGVIVQHRNLHVSLQFAIGFSINLISQYRRTYIR